MKAILYVFMGVFLALAACNSGPSSSGASKAREAEAALADRKAEHIEGLFAQRASAAQTLDSLTLALPDRVWLTEVVYNPAGTQVRGNAPTNNLLADYLARLGESPSLADVSLRGSSLKTVRGRERVEFLLQASARGAGAATSSAGDLPARQDPSEMLRQLQSLALESGLQMTKFVPGVAVDSEFTGELAATIEVAGSLADLGRYLRGLADLSNLWIAERFSLKAVGAEDPRSDVRASIAAKVYFAR